MLTPTSRTPSVKYFRLALIASLVLGAWASATSAPSQLPLLRRGNNDVDPNIFYTIDDSGSMGVTFSPSGPDSPWPGENTNHGGSIGYASPIFVPGDPMIPEYGVRVSGCIVRTPDDTNTSPAGIVAMKMRSPYFNKIYYNPEVTYRPWARANPLDTDFGDVSLSNANFDPLSRNPDFAAGAKPGAANLLNAVKADVDRNWCTSNSLETRKYLMYPATYYRYDSTNRTFKRVSLGLNEDGNPFFTQADIDKDAAFAKAKGRTDCNTVPDRCTLTEERQNFANWFTYYRTRHLLARGSSSLAFSKLETPIRLGYGRINYVGTAADGITGAPTSTVIRGVRDFGLNTATRSEFFNWLYQVPARGTTPLRRAMDDVGRYFMLEDDKGPWGNNPGTGSANKVQASCRKSYHILMTDGYWSKGTSAEAGTNTNKDIDGVDGVEITNTARNLKYIYKASATNGITTDPTYKDTTPATLADVASYYWGRDLHKNLANNVKAKVDEKDTSKPFYDAAKNIDRGDHAFWQHLTTYTVGLGVTGTISDRSPTNTPPENGWPVAKAESPEAVDDLWHAAVNGRGKFLRADNPKEFQDALEAALKGILGEAGANTGIAVSGGIIRGDTKKYVPSFVSPQWYGDVKAFNVDALADTAAPLWSAAAQLPAHGDRKLFVWNAGKPVAFNSSLPSATKTRIGATASAGASDNLINFLRGDRSNEGSVYRCRGDEPDTQTCKASVTDPKVGLFGDVIGSNPVLIGAGSDRQYQFLPKGDESSKYKAYLAARQKRGQNAIVAVGANDGFFHFLADKDGTELLGVMPSTALDNIGKLSNKSYGQSAVDGNDKGHFHFVNGPITDADAYITPTAKATLGWSNVVIGTAGGGGKSVFAFHVPLDNPASITSDHAMWEITHQSTFGADASAGSKLGFITAPVAVGRMANGKWAALFGNGMDSTSGNASLWIVDLETGQPMVAPIQVPATGSNGLGGIALVTNEQRVVVAAYGGDAKGNIWRFDLQSEAPSGWKVGLNNAPLIATGKHITAAPSYVSHPKGGLMVLFGTGKLYAAGDDALTSTQTLYGVWDVTPIGAASKITGDVAASKIAKLKLSGTSVSTEGAAAAYPIEAASSITYSDASGMRGWSLDMPLAVGERAISSPFVLFGYAYFNTLAPAAKSEGDPCDAQSSNNFLYVVDPLTGNMASFPITDTNGDGVVNAKDKKVIRIVVPGDYDDGGTPLPDARPSETKVCADGTKLVLVSSNKSSAICAPRVFNHRSVTQIANPPRK